MVNKIETIYSFPMAIRYINNAIYICFVVVFLLVRLILSLKMDKFISFLYFQLVNNTVLIVQALVLIITSLTQTLLLCLMGENLMQRVNKTCI